MVWFGWCGLAGLVWFGLVWGLGSLALACFFQLSYLGVRHSTHHTALYSLYHGQHIWR